MKKVLIFDFDGTIADTFPEFLRILNQFAEKYKFNKVDDKNIDKLRDYNTLKILQELKIPLWKVPFLLREGKAELHKTIEIVKPIKGIKEQVKKLQKAGHTLGILTSNSEKTVKKFLEKHDMEVFEFIYTGSNIFGKDKVIQAMLREKKFDEHDVLYVGDETRDIEASKRAQVKVAAVTWGFISRKGLEKYKPDFLIDKPEELSKIVQN